MPHQHHLATGRFKRNNDCVTILKEKYMTAHEKNYPMYMCSRCPAGFTFVPTSWSRKIGACYSEQHMRKHNWNSLQRSCYDNNKGYAANPFMKDFVCTKLGMVVDQVGGSGGARVVFAKHPKPQYRTYWRKLEQSSVLRGTFGWVKDRGMVDVVCKFVKHMVCRKGKCAVKKYATCLEVCRYRSKHHCHKQFCKGIGNMLCKMPTA